MNTTDSHIRVLHVIGAMNRAGAETLLMNLHQAMDPARFRFDYAVHTTQRCDYDDMIRELDGRILRLPSFRVYNRRSYRHAAKQLFEQHAGEWSIVHGHIGSCAPIYLDEARKQHLVTIAHSHSANPAQTLRDRAYKALTSPVARIADEFLACSTQAGVDRFGAEVVEGNHFHVLANGIKTSDFACSDNQHQQAKLALGMPDAPLFVHVGRFVHQKNHQFLLQVFAEIRALRPQAHLYLLGRGPLEQAVRKQAEDVGIQDAVHFLGVQDSVTPYLKAADVFLLPSILEGLGMAAVEAQAAGAPCIVSDALPEEALLTSSVVRLPLRDPKAWANAAVNLLDTPTERAQGAKQVRDAGFDIEDAARWLAGFYEQLAQQNTDSKQRITHA